MSLQVWVITSQPISRNGVENPLRRGSNRRYEILCIDARTCPDQVLEAALAASLRSGLSSLVQWFDLPVSLQSPRQPKGRGEPPIRPLARAAVGPVRDGVRSHREGVASYSRLTR